MSIKKTAYSLIIIGLFSFLSFGQTPFVKVKDHQFFIGDKPYYFIGTNYWYGTYLGLEKDKKRGIERLRKELDFLKANGVTNLRIIAGAEGSGLINNVMRVGPPLQPVQGKFNTEVLDGLDIVLAEMGKRNLKAIVFFSNNWEWSGGFQQYLIWNGRAPKDLETRKPSWDELRDIVSQFYGCMPCKAAYNEQMNLILNRTNKITKKKYVDDPAIMAWELANEPRPMRPAANEDYKKWIQDVAAMIKKKDKNHLVTLGHEGSIGTESLPLFEEIHTYKDIDYLTIHIWAKNWGWFQGEKVAEGFPNVVEKMTDYLNEHLQIAEKLNKPLVVEEFGLPRDEHSFSIDSKTTLRDEYYGKIFARVADSTKNNGYLAGANFWAFGGTSRPIKGQTFWKKGDDYMGDPPMEEQGLNTVFDSDKTTWEVINKYYKMINSSAQTSADIPIERTDKNSQIAHQQLLEKTKKGKIDLYFLGDSITRRWGTSDEQYKHFLENWRQNFFGWNAANFGWGGDTTNNVLWRLENGELDGVDPKVIVLSIGTNNIGRVAPVSNPDPRIADISKGIKAILDLCRKKAPNAKIILMGIFPRNDNPAVMPTIIAINQNIAKFADGKRIVFVNVNPKMADKEGKLFEGVTVSDGLHLDLKGYQIWADAIKPTLTKWLGTPAKEDFAPPPTGDPSAMKK